MKNIVVDDKFIPVLSIIIVNYNGKHFLADCLDSIAEHVGCTYEIIIVDNASSDGSCEFLRKHYPEVQLIESKVNTGFTGGNNIGVKHAQGNVLLLLNNDTKLTRDISLLLCEFEDPSLGVLGCRLFYGDGRQQYSFGFDHAPMRLVLSWLGLGSFSVAPNLFRRSQINFSAYEIPHADVCWVSGAFLMTPGALWEELDGLDESYFMYLEDVDYCRRVRSAGYRVAYSPKVEVIHYEGGGKAWLGGKALNNSMRSYIRYTAKFHGHLAALFMRMSLGAIMLCRAFSYGLISMVLSSVIWKEKRRAYLSASMNLFRG